MNWAACAIFAAAMFGHAQAFAQETVPVPIQRPPPQVAAPVKLPDAGPSLCALELSNAGAVFKQISPETAAKDACSIADPVELSVLSGDVALVPNALLDCPTALKLAGFVAGKIQPLATTAFGSRITQIRQDSAFVCRPRNGTSKLSEHAFGRAIDIAAFTTQAGMVVPVMVMPKDREIEATFLTNVRKAACGPFATVLGPGSDSDHATHFHFDLAPRKGSAYCR